MENIRRHFGGSNSSRQAESHSVFHTDILTSSPATVTENKTAAVADPNTQNKSCSESGKTPVSEAKMHTNVLSIGTKTSGSSPKPIPKARSVIRSDQSLTPATAGQCPPWLMTSLQTYIDSVGTLCTAATRLADEFAGQLKDSGHELMTVQFREMLQQIEMAAVGEMAQLSNDVQECWQTGKQGSRDNSTDSDLVARNLLRLLQAQYQFFHCATENITEFTRCQATSDLKSSLGHVTATTTSPVQPARAKNGVKTEGLRIDAKSVQPHCGEAVKSPGLSPSVDSPSSLRKQISSFFSKLSPKTVAPSSEGQSVFFVGLECQPQQPQPLQQSQQQQSEPQLQQELVQQQTQQQQQTLSQPEIRPKPRNVSQQRGGVERDREEKPPVTGESRDDESQATKEVATLKTPVPKGDTCIASQEELDTVINLLSCGTSVTQPVPAPRHTNISKAVGSQRSHGPPGVSPAYHQHRRSDSLTTVETVINKSKTNTWPTKLGQGFSLQDTMNQMYTYENLPADSNYPPMAGWTQMPMEYDPAYMHTGHSTWAMDDGSGQRNWPYVTTTDGQDYRGRHWSAIYDSSSCSDESSSTGEVPRMMAVDFSNAIHAGQKPVIDERATVRPAVMAINAGTTLNGGPEKAWSAKQVWTPAPPAGNWAPDTTTAPPAGQLVHPPPAMKVPWNEAARVKSLWQPGAVCSRPQQTIPK